MALENGRAPRMEPNDIPIEYRGWWRITDTTTWMKEDLDAIGTALISITGNDDRLRMLYLLANIKCKATKTGVSFTWKGSWEFDQLTGSGRVKLGNDGKLQGVFKIKQGSQINTWLSKGLECDQKMVAKLSFKPTKIFKIRDCSIKLFSQKASNEFRSEIMKKVSRRSRTLSV